MWITLIGRPAGWRAIFQMKNVNCRQAAQKTRKKGGPAGCTNRLCGGLRKRAERAAKKGSPPDRPFPQPSLMCSPLAPLNVQPTYQSRSAACRPALLCSSRIIHLMFFIWQHSPLARPASRPSV